MNRDQVLATLQVHAQELRATGVMSLSVFGSVARGEDSAQDVDIAVRLGENFSKPGFAYFSRLGRIQ